MVQHWEVVGGADKGGILVRDGKATTSKQLPDKLATGSIVEEVELVGARLNYKKVSGAGPYTGWVSISVKDSDGHGHAIVSGQTFYRPGFEQMRNRVPLSALFPSLPRPPADASAAAFAALRLSRSVGRRSGLDRGAVAGAEESKAGAEQGADGAPQEPPPHWIRLVTAVESEEDATKVAGAIAEVSENLPVRRVLVRSFQHRGAEVGEVGEWVLSVSVPPKAMLLVSSMIGEALDALSTDKLPMVLAEGLDFEGEADYVCGEVEAAAISSKPDQAAVEDLLADIGREAVEQRLAACAQIDGEAGSLLFRTTAAGRRALEQWLPSRGIDGAAVTWTPVGGNAEYLGWVAQETASSEGVGSPA